MIIHLHPVIGNRNTRTFPTSSPQRLPSRSHWQWNLRGPISRASDQRLPQCPVLSVRCLVPGCTVFACVENVESHRFGVHDRSRFANGYSNCVRGTTGCIAAGCAFHEAEWSAWRQNYREREHPSASTTPSRGLRDTTGDCSTGTVCQRSGAVVEE